jgi:peptidoglycan/LPS O-acetylase OafA/YrhL
MIDFRTAGLTISNPASDRLGYRSDIEGLRAVAILLVVAAHAKVTWLAGGFIGVDVFFVLSGYLITGLLVQEIRTTRNLRFAMFYARRFKRLLPGLLLMLGCTGVLGLLLTAPSDQPNQAIGAASAAIWLSNFHFAFSNLGYFSPSAETNLFLHTWSLGVEEQFYLIWPLLVLLTFGALGRPDRPLNPARLKLAMLIVFISSLALCILWTRDLPQFAFYMMPARAWQFALGALVFLYFGSPTARNRLAAVENGEGWLNSLIHWAGGIGLSLIVLSALMLNANVPYPGAWALLPSAGAAAVLAAGAASPRTGVGYLLSLSPMQAIGRVSYSWYLWHWPVLLLGATVLNLEDPVMRLGLVVLSLVLAVLSYEFVETPIRLNARVLVRPRMVVLSAFALMIGANALALRWHNAATRRMEQPEQMRYVTARSDAPIIYGMGCDDWYHSADVRICAFGPSEAAHTAVVMGDSVALQWFPAYAEIFNKPGWRLLIVTKSACPMVDEPFFYARFGREYTECAQWRTDALKKIADIKPDIIIFGSALNYGFTQEQWQNGTDRILKVISDAAQRVFIMRSTPVLPFDGPSCLAPRSRLYKALSSMSECVARVQDPHSDDVYAWLKSTAGHFKNVSVVDMTDAICPQGECHAEQPGVIVFRDSGHLSATFAKSLAPVLAAHLNEAMSPNAILR